MLNNEYENFKNLTEYMTRREIAQMYVGFVDCEDCKIKDICPVVIEEKEYAESGWGFKFVNSCIEIVDGYLADGMIHDKRKEKKK